MAKRTVKAKTNPDPFYVEMPEGVEVLDEPETIESYLKEWRSELRIIVAKRTTGKATERQRKAVAMRGLFHIDCIEKSSNPPYVFMATVELGACLRELQIIGSKFKRASDAGKNRRTWTASVDKAAREILSKLPKGVTTEDAKAKRVMAGLNEQGIEFGLTAIKENLFAN